MSPKTTVKCHETPKNTQLFVRICLIYIGFYSLSWPMGKISHLPNKSNIKLLFANKQKTQLGLFFYLLLSGIVLPCVFVVVFFNSFFTAFFNFSFLLSPCIFNFSSFAKSLNFSGKTIDTL